MSIQLSNDAIRGDTLEKQRFSTFIELPSKTSLCRSDGEHICEWIVVLDNGIVIPQLFLEKTGVLQRDKTYRILSALHGKTYLLLKRRSRDGYHVEAVLEKDGYPAPVDIDDETYSRYYKLWSRASETADKPSNTQLPLKPYIVVKETATGVKGALQFGDIVVIVETKQSRNGMLKYLLLNISKITDSIDKFIAKKITPILHRYGFVKGKYGGYIYRGEISKEIVDDILKNIGDELLKYRGELNSRLYEYKYSKYLNSKRKIEEARKNLGILKPADYRLDYSDVVATATYYKPLILVKLSFPSGKLPRNIASEIVRILSFLYSNGLRTDKGWLLEPAVYNELTVYFPLKQLGEYVKMRDDKLILDYQYYLSLIKQYIDMYYAGAFNNRHKIILDSIADYVKKWETIYLN